MTAIVTFFRLCATAAILCMIAGAIAVHGQCRLSLSEDQKTVTITFPEYRPMRQSGGVLILPPDTFIRPVPTWAEDQWKADSIKKIKECNNERKK